MQSRKRHSSQAGFGARGLEDVLALSRRGAIGLVALVAFLFQAFACTTHWHWSQSASLDAVAVHGVVAGGEISGDEQPAAPLKFEPCQLCQAMGSNSRFLSASALSIPAPLSALVAWHAADTKSTTLIRPSHAWRGRAPPSSFEIV